MTLYLEITKLNVYFPLVIFQKENQTGELISTLDQTVYLKCIQRFQRLQDTRHMMGLYI